MNYRQKKLIHYLTENNESFFTSSELSEKFSCSARTIRSDISTIEKFVAEYGVEIIRKNNKGIKLNIDQGYIREFLKNVALEGEYTQEENMIRKYNVLILLLMSNKSVSLDYLADKFYTSKRNIRVDLNKVMYLITKYNLELTIKTGVGILVKGNEIHKRELLSFLTKLLNKKTNSRKTLYELFDEQEIEIVNRSINLLSLELRNNIEESPINGISLHILFMLKRIKNNEDVKISAEEWNMLRKSQIINEANKVALFLSKELNIDFSDDEIGYLALRLNCLYRPAIDEIDDFENRKIVLKLLNVIGDLYGIDLKQNMILTNNLLSHMGSSLKRIKSGFHISNPIINEIKKEYTQLFLIIQMVLDEYYLEGNLYFPEEEIGYIAVHFQAAFERINNASMNLKTIIITSYGMGVATFIKAKLANNFPNIEVLDIILGDHLYSYLKKNEINFILSTKKKINTLGHKMIVITPLLDEIDLMAIDNLIKDLVKNPQREFDIMKYSNPFLVYLDWAEENKYTIIKNLVRVLEKQKYVEKNTFMNSVISREKLSNTNIGKFIAIPHGNPDLVLESSISFAIIKDSVWWSDSNVKIVVLLALKKDALMTGELKTFFKILNNINNNDELIEKIVKERRKLKLLEYFSGNEVS